MRTIGFILLAAITVSCASSLPPAEPSDNMMEQADKVILTINEDPERAFNNLRNHLIDKGYSIQKANLHKRTLQTGYREYGATVFGILGGYSMKIFASIDDSKVTFSGVLSTGTEVENNGGETSPVKSGWNEIISIAREFPHEEIYFSRN